MTLPAILHRALRAAPGIVSMNAWLPTLRRLPPASGQRSVGLSFDDGPSPETTPAILALLARHNASATFFLTGERIERHPDLVAATVAAGHAVFAHGYRHLAYASEPDAVMHAEMSRTEALLQRFRPKPEPYLVRLPYMSGRRLARMHRAIRRWQPTAQLAFWRFGFDDYRLADGCADLAMVRDRCIAAAAPVLARADLPGAILLLHEAPYDTDAALAPAVGPLLTGIVLDGLAARGLKGCALQPSGAPSPLSRFIQL